jgi:hypothetical protein
MPGGTEENQDKPESRDCNLTPEYTSIALLLVSLLGMAMLSQSPVTMGWHVPRSRHRWKDNIKMDYMEQCEGVDWMHMAQDGVQ